MKFLPAMLLSSAALTLGACSSTPPKTAEEMGSADYERLYQTASNCLSNMNLVGDLIAIDTQDCRSFSYLMYYIDSDDYWGLQEQAEAVIETEDATVAAEKFGQSLSALQYRSRQINAAKRRYRKADRQVDLINESVRY